MEELGNAVDLGIHKPKVVCLCGSSKFRDVFNLLNFVESVAGNIVLSIAPFIGRQPTPHEKRVVDAVYFRKIDMADEILVINVGGYVGISTTREIWYAKASGKLIRWYDPSNIPILPDWTEAEWRAKAEEATL